MSNGDTAYDIVLSQAERVREVVERANYDKCPVGGQRDVNLFMIDAMSALLTRRDPKAFTWLSSGVGASIGGIAGGAIGIFGKILGWW